MEKSVDVDLGAVEEQLVSVCRQLVSRRWQSTLSGSRGIQQQQQQQQHHQHLSDNEMNLLHLAAALGLLRVICSLLNWRLENSSTPLENETNPLACDTQGYTPLVHHPSAFIFLRKPQESLRIHKDHFPSLPPSFPPFPYLPPSRFRL